MKEGAEKVELKIQAKVESLKHANEGDKGMQMVEIFVSLFRFVLLFQFPSRLLFLQWFLYQSEQSQQNNKSRIIFVRIFSFLNSVVALFSHLNCHSHEYNSIQIKFRLVFFLKKKKMKKTHLNFVLSY